MKYNFEMSKIVNGVNELFYFLFSCSSAILKEDYSFIYFLADVEPLPVESQGRP